MSPSRDGAPYVRQEGGAPKRRRREGRVLTRIRAALLALVAIAAVTAPTAGADGHRVIRTSIEFRELSIFDLYLTTACGTEVSATISGLLEKKLVLDEGAGQESHGVAAREIDWFVGQITWYTEAGKSYSSTFSNRSQIDFPQGLDLFKPARITVTGHHGGTFPIGGGPPGRGTLVYDAFVYAIDDEGFPFVAVEGDPIPKGGNFERATERICAALT